MLQREQNSKQSSRLYSQLVVKRNEMLAALFDKLNSERRELKEDRGTTCNKR